MAKARFFRHSVPAVTLTGKCPQCGERLVVRSARDDQAYFIGCDAYPACRFTCPYDSALQALHRRMLIQPQTAPEARHLIRQAVDRELRRLITLTHPDKWHQGQPATALADELTKALVALRERLKEV